MMKKSFAFMAAAVLALACLTGCGSGGSRLAANAKTLVNQILRDDVGPDAAKCLKVEITEKLAKGHYRGIAKLDNGNDVKIMIENDAVKMTVTVIYDEETSSSATMRHASIRDRQGRRRRGWALEKLLE